ncbi:MAG TPA: EAL domain-containing protein, partial [Bryobacteraceae bacterium]|nr:EAL domain-containing protein [Bryobacteraceae bacterium]
SNEYRIVRGDGTIRFIRSRGFPVLDEQGNPTRLAGVAQDVTSEAESRAALARSESRFSKLVESDLIGIVSVELTGRILEANATSLAMSGYSREEVESGLLRWDEMLAPGYEQIARDVVAQLKATGRADRVEVAFRRKDGSLLYTLMGLASPDPERNTAIGFVLDLTARRQIEEQLRKSEENLGQFAASIREVLWLMDMATSELLFVSPAYEQIWKRSRESLHSDPRSWLEAVHPDDRVSVESAYLRRLAGEIADNEYRIVQPDGAVRWIRDRVFPIRDDIGRIVRLGGVAEDVTEWKQYEASLRHQALHDQLTDLPNRRLLMTELAEAMERQKETLDSLAVFFIDIDHFKLVNDSFGHAAGDQLLCEAARRLRRITRETDTLARTGGDEFALVACGFSNRNQAQRLGQKLLDCLEAPFTLEGREIFIGATLGISLFPGDANDAEVLLRNAAAAAQQARRRGRGQVTFFSGKFAEETRERLSMESCLRRALVNGEFRLQYQPQFALGGASPTRYEALIRWYPCEREPVPPANFIPLAEENGLIVPIGTWVLEEACRTAAAWQYGERAGVGVAVNVSARQFADPEFVALVAATVRESGLAPHLLELELTETVFIADLDDSARKLRQLKSLGVSIALDDFGTGYSSLGYLQNLPIDVIKIDRSFITETGQKESGEAVLRCLIDLAHALGIRVIAEGVETPAQLDLLRRLGCDELQGFLLGRPDFETVAVSV